MNRLDDLIQKYCPNGIEFKKIKEVAEVGTGSSNTKEAIDNGKYPFFVRSQNIKTKNNFEFDEEAIIIPGEGGVGEIFHYINGKYSLHQRVYRIHFIDMSVNTKFIYYYMKAFFKNFILKKAVSATVVSIRKPMINEFKIPIPPFPIQEEIVRILDSFTKLTEELTEELTERKKQYEYYHNELLNFDDNISIKKLFEVAEVYDSLHQTPKYSQDKYSMIRVQDIKKGYINIDSTMKVSKDIFDKFTKKYKPQKNDIVVSRVGSYGNFAIIPNDCCCLGQNIAIIHPNINSKYIYYVLTSNKIKYWINKMVKGASHKSFSLADIKKIPIPIPHIEEQKRIVTILDKFDTLCNDLSIGLPAEIEARKKQYEYYRDKLLTFKELKQ